MGTQQLKLCLFNLQHLVEQMLSFPKPVLVELGVELVMYGTDVNSINTELCRRSLP